MDNCCPTEGFRSLASGLSIPLSWGERRLLCFENPSETETSLLRVALHIRDIGRVGCRSHLCHFRPSAATIPANPLGSGSLVTTHKLLPRAIDTVVGYPVVDVLLSIGVTAN